MDEENLDLKPLQAVLEQYRGQKGSMIPVLQKAQEIYGWLPSQVLEVISRGLRVSLSDIYGVVTFYSQFYLNRRGRHVVRQCDGTACHVRGAARIIDTVQNRLGVKAGETTQDYRVTYEVVYCLGSCGLAPVAMVDEKVTGNLVPERMVRIVDGLN